MAGMVGNIMQTIFGTAPPSANTQKQANSNQSGNPAQNQNTPNPADPNPQNNPNNPANPAATRTGQNQDGKLPNGQDGPKGDESPLANYNDIFTIENKQTSNEPIVKFDSKVFDDTLKTLDFTKGLPPDLMTKALAGDQTAFMEALNFAAKSSFGMQTKLVTSLVEKALTKQKEQINSGIPENVRSAAIRNQLTSENPAFKHPAVAPILTAIETQLRNKYPDSSPAEISEHAKTYFSGMAEMVSGKKNQEQNPGTNKRTVNGTDDVNWEEFAGFEFDKL